MDVVVFDFGNVLVEWDPKRLFRQLCEDDAEVEAFMAEIDFAAWNSEFDRGLPIARGVAEAIERHPARRALLEAYRDRWIETIVGPITGTVELLHRLADRGAPLYGLTNWSAETFPLVRDDPRYGFFDRFEAIVVSGEVGLIKPDRAIFEHAQDVIGREPGACVFFDDSPANVEAARAAGWRAHRFETPGEMERRLVEIGLL